MSVVAGLTEEAGRPVKDLLKLLWLNNTTACRGRGAVPFPQQIYPYYPRLLEAGAMFPYPRLPVHGLAGRRSQWALLRFITGGLSHETGFAVPCL